jgi:hypothetical protein
MFALGLISDSSPVQHFVIVRILAISEDILVIPSDTSLLEAFRNILKQKPGLTLLAILEEELPDRVATVNNYFAEIVKKWKSAPRECIVAELAKIGHALGSIESFADLTPSILAAPTHRYESDADEVVAEPVPTLQN